MRLKRMIREVFERDQLPAQGIQLCKEVIRISILDLIVVFAESPPSHD